MNQLNGPRDPQKGAHAQQEENKPPLEGKQMMALPEDSIFADNIADIGYRRSESNSRSMNPRKSRCIQKRATARFAPRVFRHIPAARMPQRNSKTTIVGQDASIARPNQGPIR
jgi:hypothetical protein